MPQTTDSRADFLRLASGEDFEASGGLLLHSAEWDAEAFRLKLDVDPGEAAPRQTWMLHADLLLDERLTSEWSDTVFIGRDHPVMVPFIEDEIDLYFTENQVSSAELLGVVALACAGRMNDWHSPSSFLNQGLPLASEAVVPFGHLGRFPISVGERVLQSGTGRRLRLTSLNRRRPVYWDGGEWREYSATVEAFVFGSSFVVGEGLRLEPA